MRFLVRASTEFEADAILDRLADAGVQAVPKGGAFAWAAKDIYVEAGDLETARQVLANAGSVSDEELAEQSEQAFREATEGAD
jgi:Putative prokaryotic signal transducing protein